MLENLELKHNNTNWVPFYNHYMHRIVKRLLHVIAITNEYTRDLAYAYVLRYCMYEIVSSRATCI